MTKGRGEGVFERRDVNVIFKRFKWLPQDSHCELITLITLDSAFLKIFYFS